jgi:hypothetical protein
MEKKIVYASDLVKAEYAILALLKRIDRIAIGVGSTDYLSMCIQEGGGDRYYSVNNRYYDDDKDKPLNITEIGGKIQ